MKYANTLDCRLDLESAGKRFGAVDLVVSDDRHAFMTMQIPIVVIAQGRGPTVLLCAGNHGDEYEGQIVLRRLIHGTEPAQVNGRLIILPALNYPAVLADMRVSPIDGANLNRSFPGRADGGPTASIADYVTRSLLPISDAAVDFHTGGRRAEYVPCGFICTHPDADIMRRSLAMVEAFGAPFTFVLKGSDGPAGFDPVAHAAGVPCISTELAGGGGVSTAATEIGHVGLRRMLHALGVLEAGAPPPASPTRFLDAMDGSTVVMSSITGFFEPFHRVGEEVSAGQPAGRVWSLEEVERPPVDMVFPGAGVIAIRRNTGRVQRGSHLYAVTPELSRAAVLKATGLT